MNPAHVRRVRSDLCLLETRVDDFDVRSAVVLGDRSALVWDTLAHPDQMAPANALLRGRPFTVVYSHADWDHVWGTAGLDGCRAIVAHRAAAERFQHEVPSELATRRRHDAGVWDSVRLLGPTSTFVRQRTVDLGGLRVVLHALPGHTADCIVAWIPRWGVVLAGDTMETPLPILNGADQVQAWIDGLARLEQDGSVHDVIPSHGEAGGRGPLLETLRYLRAMASGRAPALPPDLDPFYRRAHEKNLELMGVRCE